MKEEFAKEVYKPERLMYKMKEYGMDDVFDDM